MISIQEPNIQLSSNQSLLQQPILNLAFRSYFLLAVLCSFASLALWAAILNGYVSFSNSHLSATTWHIHEMIFGFAATVAVGFILTASQTWTKQPSIKGAPLAMLIIIWFMVRAALLVDQALSIYVAIGLQTIWWLGAIFSYAKQVLVSRNKRNYLFIPILCAMMVTNIGLLLLDSHGFAELSLHFARTAVLLFCLLMGILGGRVIPFFTASGAKLDAIKQPQWLSTALLLTSVVGVAIFFIGYFVELYITPAPLMMLAGILHLCRLAFWQTLATVKIPLLWSLHLAYLMMAIGLILLALSYFNWATHFITFANALHVITISAMGLMIFAMMCRVSLGHTGRPLTPHPFISWLFGFIFVSAIARVLMPIMGLVMLGWNLSILLWLIASLIFLIIYSPILFKPRQVQGFYRPVNKQ